MGVKERRFSHNREAAECGEPGNVDQVCACGRPGKLGCQRSPKVEQQPGQLG